MRATSGDFNRVMQVVKDQICRALGEKHQSMEMFKVCYTKQPRSPVVQRMNNLIQSHTSFIVIHFIRWIK